MPPEKRGPASSHPKLIEIARRRAVESCGKPRRHRELNHAESHWRVFSKGGGKPSPEVARSARASRLSSARQLSTATPRPSFLGPSRGVDHLKRLRPVDTAAK